jgi:predicted O-linked N-acetylglucosamine transferase (SPINDLY family)
MNKIKIGFIGQSFGVHSVGWLSRWLIRSINRDRFDIHIWSIGGMRDDYLAKAFRCMGTFYDCSHGSPETIHNSIRESKLDVLIELDSLTMSSTLALAVDHPCDRIVSWLGWDHPGLPRIDYFLVDDHVIDPSVQYSAQLLKMPHTYIAVNGFEMDVPTYRKEDIDIPKDAIVLQVSQSVRKYSEEFLNTVCRIMKGLPDAYLMFKTPHDQYSELITRKMLSHGVDPNRLRFMGMVFSEEQQRANLRVCDLILDTFPYNGCTTTLEALWAETPVIALEGKGFTSRQSASFLKSVECSDLVAQSVDEYIEKAIAIGSDRDRIRAKNIELKESKQWSYLWNVGQFAIDFENTIEGIL